MVFDDDLIKSILKVGEAKIELKIDKKCNIDTHFEGRSIDIIGLLVMGTKAILKSTNIPMTVYVKTLLASRELDNRSEEEKRMDDVIIQMLKNSIKK